MKKVAFVVAGVLLLVTLAVVPGRSITNGNFETGTLSGWTVWNSSFASVVLDPRTGSPGLYSAYLHADNMGDNLWQYETGANVGETWRLRGWLKCSYGGWIFEWFEMSASTDGAGQSGGSTSGVWVELGPFDQPINSTSWTVYVYFYGTSWGSSDVRVDDITTEKVSAVEDWCFY